MDYKNKLDEFENFLVAEEKSKNTIEKYLRDVKSFFIWLNGRAYKKSDDISIEILLEYKEHLKKVTNKTSSINSKISSLNVFFSFVSSNVLKIKLLKCQKSLFGSEEKELTFSDVKKLINVSKSERNRLIIETIVSTGIRVSELSAITVSAVEKRKAVVNNKGKERVVLIPTELSKKLVKYCTKNNIVEGAIFITKNGKPVDRRQIWKMMKNLCEKAGVDKTKVFPHNLRHLFAREYFKKNKDIVKLASILGHSSIETTRIYALETEEECRISIEKMGFLHILE